MSEHFERADSLRRVLNVTAFIPGVCLVPYFIGAAIQASNSKLTDLAFNVMVISFVTVPLGFLTLLILLTLALNFWLKNPRLQKPIQVLPNHAKQMRWAIISSIAPFVAYLGLVVQDSSGPRWYLQDEIQLPANTLFFGSIAFYSFGLIQIVIAKIMDKKNGDPVK